MRFAAVTVVNAGNGAELGTTHTDANGNYSVNVPNGGTLSVQLRVEARNTDTTDRIAIQVLSDESARTLLTAAGPAASRDTSSSLTIDLDVPVAGGGAGAFNIFDCGVRAQEFINRFSSRTPPLLTFFWQPTPDGQGSDDGTYFTDDNSIHLLNRATPNANQPNAPNADEFDDSVILHETGHYLLANYSVDKSRGGVHFIDGDHSDLRLAWSEGWATYWGSIIDNTPFQVNSFGTRVGAFEIETPDFAAGTTGFDTEQSVSAILWDIFDVDASPNHPQNGVDDDAMKIADGAERVLQVILNDYTFADDAIWEDFYNKFRRRHGDQFLRPALEDNMAARQVFVTRTNVFENTTPTTLVSPGTATSTIDVPVDLTATSLKVFVSANVRTTFDNVNFEFRAPDYIITLRSPGGTTVTLHNRGAVAAEDGFFDWYSPAETQLPAGQSFASFVGQQARGTWTLSIQDVGTGQQGQLRKWKLDIGGTATGSDLSVVSVAAPTLAAQGGALPVVANVRNGGNTATNQFLVRYFLSTDTTINPTDTSLGDETVASLAGATTVTVTRTATVPSNLAPGTYFVGAIADPDGQIGETNEANNASANPPSVAISGSGANLVITNLTLPASAPVNGQLGTSLVINNTGGVPVTGTFTTRLFLTQSGVIDGQSIQLGSFDQTGLAVNANLRVDRAFTVPAATPTGSYTVCARIDATNVIAELSETDNTLCNGPVALITPGSQADLFVSQVSAAANVGLGATLPVTLTIQNLGGTSAPAFTAELFLSTTTTLGVSPTSLGAFAVSALASGDATTLTRTPTVPANLAPGAYFVIARADTAGVVAESNENNNERASAVVGVGASNVDLAVSQVTPPATATVNLAFPVTASVTNVGTVDITAPFVTRFYLSTDNTITAADTLVGEVSTAALGIGQNVTLTNTASLPVTVTSGVYFAGAIAEAASGETNLANNAAASAITVAVSANAGAQDVAVTNVTGPVTATSGGFIAPTAAIANVGTVDVNAVFNVRFFLSTDATVTTGDLFLGDVQLSSLRTGQAPQTLAPTFAVPAQLASGSYFIGVIADPEGRLSDANRANNSSVAPASTLISVTGRLPDLATNGVLVPPNVNAGSTAVVLESIANTGAGVAPQGYVSRWFLSTDALITTADTQVGTFFNSPLQPGSIQQVTRQLNIPSSLASGTYRFGVILDPDQQVPETDETNNALASTPVTVTSLASGADLAVPDAPLVVPAQTSASGFGSITFSVRNQGSLSANGPFSVGVYLMPTPVVGTNGLFLGSVNLPTLAPGAVSAPVTFPFQIPPTVTRGPFFIGVVADITRAVADVNRLNNASPGVSLNVEDAQQVPDLIALTADGPFTAQRGSQQTFTARIANNGARAVQTAFRTRFTLRSGAAGTVTLGTVTTPSLGAFQSTQLTLSTAIPVSLAEDAYFLETTVDADDAIRPEVTEANNTFTRPQTLAVTAATNVANLAVTTVNVSPASVVIGQNILVTGTISNSGTVGTLNPFTAGIFLSRNQSVSTTDTVIDSFQVTAINAGAATIVQRTVRVPPTLLPGTFFVGLIANTPATIIESRTDDNSGSAPITVVAGPDLSVQSVTFNPNQARPGDTITFNTTVRNGGQAAVVPPPTRLINRYFLSTKSPVTANDILLGIDSVPIDGGIPVSSSVASVNTLTLPSNLAPGSYFIGVLTDATGAIAEQREDNNLLTTTAKLTVLGGAQLKAVSTSAPATAAGGTLMPVAVSIQNTGFTNLLVPVEVAFSLVGINAPFTVVPLITTSVAAQNLAPGATRTFAPSIPVDLTVPPGLYKLRARLDPSNAIPEVDESDGTHVVDATGVTQVTQVGVTGPTVDITLSPNADPVPAGPLTIIATFSDPVSQPTISIDTPGTNRLPPTPMNGSGTLWSFNYNVPRDNGAFDRDGVYAIRIEGALDADGLPNAPPTGSVTFTTDTIGPVLQLDGLHDGDLISDAPAISGSVTDALTVNAELRIVGTPSGSDVVTFVQPPPGTFAFGPGTLAVPGVSNQLTLSGTDAAGNVGIPFTVTVLRDSDTDGMPDSFEQANGLDSFDASDATAQAAGYAAGITNRDVFDFGLTLSNPPATDPRLGLAIGQVPPLSTVPPGVLRPSVTVTSPGAGTPSFAWRQVTGPKGTVLNATTASPAFIAKAPGRYEFEVRITNAAGRSSPLVQAFDVINAPPKAQLVPGSAVSVGQDVLLDAGLTTDLNDQPLTYVWRADPANPSATDRFTSTARASFIPLAPGTFRYFVKARDSLGLESAEASAEFHAADPASAGVPSADAGLDQTVASGPAVTLDGTSSTAGTAGGTLSYQWVQLSGPPVSLVGPTSATPVFQAVTPGTLEFGLTVTNNTPDRLVSARDTVRVVVTSKAARHPTADAGPDQRRLVGDLVPLDGTRSVAVAGGSLTFTWTQVSGPALSGPIPSLAQPTFSPALPGEYVLQLVVDEGGVVSPPDTVTVRVNRSASEQPPVANVTLAGLPLRQAEYRVRLTGLTLDVALDGSSSFDPQGRPLTFRWTQVAGPAVALSSREIARPTFTTSNAGIHSFLLTVDNGVTRASARLDVLVDPVSGSIPTPAIAPLDSTTLQTGTKVVLTGTSTTAEVGARTFRWVQTGGPIVALVGAGSDKPEFTPTIPGTYTFALFVTDGTLRSLAATTTFAVVQAPPAPTTPDSPDTGAGSPGLDTGSNSGGGGGGGGCHAGRNGAADFDPFVLLVWLAPFVTLLQRRR